MLFGPNEKAGDSMITMIVVAAILAFAAIGTTLVVTMLFRALGLFDPLTPMMEDGDE